MSAVLGAIVGAVVRKALLAWLGACAVAFVVGLWVVRTLGRRVGRGRAHRGQPGTVREHA